MGKKIKHRHLGLVAINCKAYRSWETEAKLYADEAPEGPAAIVTSAKHQRDRGLLFLCCCHRDCLGNFDTATQLTLSEREMASLIKIVTDFSSVIVKDWGIKNRWGFGGMGKKKGGGGGEE